jgi:hypothetical protein
MTVLKDRPSTRRQEQGRRPRYLPEFRHFLLTRCRVTTVVSRPRKATAGATSPLLERANFPNGAGNFATDYAHIDAPGPECSGSRVLELARKHIATVASWLNTGLALGIVFVMTTKPHLAPSIAALLVAATAGATVGLHRRGKGARNA